MKYVFNFIFSFLFIQAFLSDAYSTELQEEQSKRFSAYVKLTAKAQEEDQVCIRFIVRLIRTKEEIDNKQNYEAQGFKHAFLNDIANYLNTQKDNFSDQERLILVNFKYHALLTIEPLLHRINPYFIEINYTGNIPIDQNVSNFFTRLRNTEDKRQERLLGNNTAHLRLTPVNLQEEKIKDHRNYLQSQNLMFIKNAKEYLYQHIKEHHYRDCGLNYRNGVNANR